MHDVGVAKGPKVANLAEESPTEIEQRPQRSVFRWIVLALICLIYMMVAVDRANLGIALPSIKDEFNISNTEAGLFATLMFLAFAASQIPSSFLCHRFGPHKLMTVALVLTAVASYLLGTSASTRDINAYRALLGAVEAAISVCCMATINHWFSVRERGTATGYFWGASKMGPVICPPITILILQAFGWRAIFQFFAFPVIVAAFLWYSLVRAKPEQSNYVSQAELEKIRAPDRQTPERRRDLVSTSGVPAWLDKIIRLKPVKLIDTGSDVFRSWNIIGITIATIFMVGIFNVFLAWIPSYLIDAKHLPLGTVGIVTTTPFAGAVAGNLASGWLSDKLLEMRRKPLMMLGALFSAIAIFCLIYSPASAIFTGALLLLTGFVVGLGYPHLSIYPMSLTTREIYPIAYGVTNTGAALGAALFPLIAGVILDAYNWDVLFVFLGGSSVLCLIFLATIVEPVVGE